MTDERIEKTKSAVESAGNIPADKKAELLGLLSKLKPAIAKVSQTHQEDAQSIARLVEASAQETIRAQKKPERIKRLSHELKQSVETFEASHRDGHLRILEARPQPPSRKLPPTRVLWRDKRARPGDFDFRRRFNQTCIYTFHWVAPKATRLCAANSEPWIQWGRTARCERSRSYRGPANTF